VYLLMAEDHTTQLLVSKHVGFIKGLNEKKDTFEYWATEHLRLNGMYWGIGGLRLLKSENVLDRDEVIQFVLSCAHPSGGFGGNVNHDAHLLYTLSAVQILFELDAADKLDKDKIAAYVSKLQRPDGSFTGDEWGEIDTRFTYCAVNCLALLGKLDLIDKAKAVEFIEACKNFDGGFGSIPGAESHAGQCFTCVGALAILGRLDVVDQDLLGWWLSERQVPEGGMNGRPEKKPDVCYSWWVLSSLCAIDRLTWIDRQKLRDFILKCQDTETGGFADRPGDVPDVFHCFFGIGGLSLMGFFDVETIDPVYALTATTLQKHNIATPWHNYRRN